MTIEPLTRGDLSAALALSTAEGWNQTAADWARMVALAPAGCFAASEDGHLIATVTTTSYGRDLAWIGMMVVHPGRRRRGIGADRSRLLRALAAGSVGGPLAAAGPGGALAGFAMARAGRTAAYVGPIVARDAPATTTLLDAALARLAGGEVCLDRHERGRLTRDVLEDRGLSPRRELMRMRHGPPVVSSEPAVVSAGAGPEFG